MEMPSTSKNIKFIIKKTIPMFLAGIIVPLIINVMIFYINAKKPKFSVYLKPSEIYKIEDIDFGNILIKIKKIEIENSSKDIMDLKIKIETSKNVDDIKINSNIFMPFKIYRIDRESYNIFQLRIETMRKDQKIEVALLSIDKKDKNLITIKNISSDYNFKLNKSEDDITLFY